MEAKLVLSSWATRFTQWWSELLPSARLYAAGLLVFGIGLCVALLAPNSFVANWASALAMFCLGLGVIRECYTWLIRRKDHPLAKFAIALLAIMAAALSTGAGGMVLSAATGQDPSHFKTSIAFVAPLAFIPILAIMIFAVALFGFPIVLLLGWSGRFGGALTVARGLGLLGILIASGYLLKPESRINSAIQGVASYSAYFLDMYPAGSCSGIAGDRITRINDQLVVLGRITDAGPRFVRRSCTQTPEAVALAPPRAHAKSSKPSRVHAVLTSRQ